MFLTDITFGSMPDNATWVMESKNITTRRGKTVEVHSIVNPAIHANIRSRCAEADMLTWIDNRSDNVYGCNNTLYVIGDSYNPALLSAAVDGRSYGVAIDSTKYESKSDQLVSVIINTGQYKLLSTSMHNTESE